MIADSTMDTMAEQNGLFPPPLKALLNYSEKLMSIQDDMAEMHDDINSSERKLASTKDFFGNLFKKKKVDHMVRLPLYRSPN